jgi:hypothetical protein
MNQNEGYMAEATIGVLANLATATAADRDVVAALTQANSRLAKQLEGKLLRVEGIEGFAQSGTA